MISAFHNSQPFDLNLLLFPGIVLFLSLLILGYLGSRTPTIALLIATLKTSFFILYFGYIFDGTYTTRADDEYYLVTGYQLYMFFLDGTSEVTIDNIRNIVGASHFIYNILNAIAFLLFGVFYFSPVVINIIISAAAAVISVKIIKQQQILCGRHLNYFFLFFVLHPELLSWSTVFNLKDTLVLFMHVLLLYAVSLFVLQKKMAALFIGLSATVILVGLRFYVPFIFGLSFLMYIITGMKLNFKKVITFGTSMSLFFLFAVPWNYFTYSLKVYKTSMINPLTGTVHFLLAPRPFFTDEIYRVLNFASLIHWLFFPMFLMGIYVGLKPKNKFIYFLFIYLLTFTFFYGSFEFLNGSRHRLQLLFAISVFQFIGLKWFIRQIFPHKVMNYPDKAGTKLSRKLDQSISSTAVGKQ
jgi:hypothetical protein